jgi:predicted amidophosphoribosyltransferase
MQGNLSADARRRNVQGAFRVRRGRAKLVKGKRVLLVDDVLTTGATAEACARTLKRAGAACVDVITLARVAGPRTTPI